MGATLESWATAVALLLVLLFLLGGSVAAAWTSPSWASRSDESLMSREEIKRARIGCLGMLAVLWVGAILFVLSMARSGIVAGV